MQRGCQEGQILFSGPCGASDGAAAVRVRALCGRTLDDTARPGGAPNFLPKSGQISSCICLNRAVLAFQGAQEC